MKKEIIKEMVEAFGWIEVDSKNPYMWSFMKHVDETARMNVYFTTGTVQVQTSMRQDIRKTCTLKDIEELINKY